MGAEKGRECGGWGQRKHEGRGKRNVKGEEEKRKEKCERGGGKGKKKREKRRGRRKCETEKKLGEDEGECWLLS